MPPVHSTFCPACICQLSKCTWVWILSNFPFSSFQMSGRQAQQTTQGQVGTARTETTTSEKSGGGGGGGLGGLVCDVIQL